MNKPIDYILTQFINECEKINSEKSGMIVLPAEMFDILRSKLVSKTRHPSENFNSPEPTITTLNIIYKDWDIRRGE